MSFVPGFNALRRPSRSLVRGIDNRGVSTVELALLLPILGMIFLGLIDLGFAWTALGRVADAARHGARVAAAATGINNTVPVRDRPCRSKAGRPNFRYCDCPTIESRRCMAVDATLDALESAGMPRRDFQVGVKFIPHTEDGVTATVVSVSADRRRNSRFCIFCLGNLLEGGQHAEASFVLEP